MVAFQRVEDTAAQRARTASQALSLGARLTKTSPVWSFGIDEAGM